MNPEHPITRREFVTTTSKAVAGAVLLSQMLDSAAAMPQGKKRRLAMVGTGHRGSGMWGQSVMERYGDIVEFVGLCDSNPGRVETARKMIGASCPTFTNYEEMLTKTKPDTVIVTTVDGTHHTFIAKALEMGIDVITEKPMSTDETKLKVILDAAKKSKNKLIMAHNYRYPPTAAKVKELLMQERVGRVT